MCTLRAGSNVSLLCLNFLLPTPSQIAPKFYFLVELRRAKIQSQVEAGHGWEGFHAKIWLRQCEQNELSYKMCILFYETEELLERHVTSLFSLSVRSGAVTATFTWSYKFIPNHSFFMKKLYFFCHVWIFPPSNFLIIFFWSSFFHGKLD